MVKFRIERFVKIQVLEAIGVDYIDGSEALTVLGMMIFSIFITLN